MTDPWVRALAPAKVNLTLQVLAKRPDGYHEIRSWMLALGLCDRVSVRATGSGRVEARVHGPAASADVPSDAENLAVRAAEALLDEARARGLVGPSTGLDLDLEKHVPSRAGLGGGSSDAAAAWIAARRALSVDVPDEVGELALARLGSDCVFFQKAHTGLGIATGRGEVVERADAPIPRWSIALVTPECGAATATVYRAVVARALPRERDPSTVRARITEPATHARRWIENDLEAAAIAAVPALAAWRSSLDRADCAHWKLCGSGSSWFGLYDTDDDAQAALRRVESDARALGLGMRLARVVRAAGHGAVLVPES